MHALPRLCSAVGIPRLASRRVLASAGVSAAAQRRSMALRIAVIGLPGGGKGTQCSMIERDFGLLPISTGNLLRDIIRGEGMNTDESTRKEVEEIIERGDLVPDNLMTRIVKQALGAPECVEKGWILDGYPRSTEQADILHDTILSEIGQQLDKVFYIDVPEDVILQRVSGRRIHESSGRVYNIHFKPPKEEGKDDETGEALIQRPDDEPDTVKARINKYKNQTVPVIEYYRDKGLLATIPSPTSPDGYAIIKNLLVEMRQAHRL